MGVEDFSARVIAWQRQHGRRDLPWQRDRTPYRVWISEIMLQQTQVATALPYFERFLKYFPTVFALAEAPVDSVLAHWSGLGYYARARNLHRCARQLVARHDGVFPATAHELEALPGIGRSTAAAIAAFCHGERVPILDANVKRVLVRHKAVDGDFTASETVRQLWRLAEQAVQSVSDTQGLIDYTQGLMDLGAMVCTPRRPQCPVCPVAADCCALALEMTESLPVRLSPRPRRETRAMWLLHVTDRADRAFLVPRTDHAIWGGLYCFPEYADRDQARLAAEAIGWTWVRDDPPVTHGLTHMDLVLHRMVYRANTDQSIEADAPGIWIQPDRYSTVGLPAPIRRLLVSA